MDIASPETQFRRYLQSVDKAFIHVEALRRNEVMEQVNNHVKKMIDHTQQLQSIYNTKLKHVNDELKSKELLTRLIDESINEDDLLISKQFGEIRKSSNKNEMSNLANNVRELQKKREQMEIKKREEIRIKYQQLEEVHSVYEQFKSRFDNLMEIIINCTNKEELTKSASLEIQQAKQLSDRMNFIYSKCKSNTLEYEEVIEPRILLDKLIQLESNLKSLVDELNNKIEVVEMDTIQKENVTEDAMVEHKTQIPKTEISSEKKPLLEKYVNAEAYAFYTSYKNINDELENVMQSINNDPKWKSFRMQCLKDAFSPVNMISPENKQHMLDKYQKLCIFLRGTSYRSYGIDDNICKKYCIYALAKKFVSQGEDVVSSKPEAVFPIASIIVNLWTEYEEFGSAFMGHIMERCPYLIPAKYLKEEGKSINDHYLLSKEHGNGTADRAKYLKKMGGITRLYAAVTVSEARGKKPHPHGLKYAWRWLAATLNLEPLPEITATLLLDFLEVVWFKMSKCYGVQFQKLIHLLCVQYIPKIEEFTEADSFKGPTERLQLFLEISLKSQSIRKPPGYLEADFW